MQETPTQKHKYYDLACHAYAWSSFNPERRAAEDCKWYDATCEELKALGNDWALEKFTRLFLKSLAAKSRCASPMVTGPARFPVARMQKYNHWEQNATNAMIEFLDKARKPPRPPGPARTELDYGIDQKEYELNGVKVMHNAEQKRLQLYFPDKPDPHMIATLKGRGFKWSPRNKAWQRQLTPNAILAATSILKPSP